MSKKDAAALFGCYLIWGFQPLYWGLMKHIDSLTILALRIIFGAVFSVAILMLQGRASDCKRVLKDRAVMKFILPAAVFLLADWAVFIIVVNSGHILDAGIGYYINPLILFLAGVIVYREKCERAHIVALAMAAVGVIISTAAFGSFRTYPS